MFNNYKRIVLRSPNWIGDAMMAAAAVSWIVEAFSRSEIFIAAPSWSSSLWNYIDLEISGVVNLEKGKRIQNILKLKSLNADLIIYLTNSFSTALEGYLARIPQRWGYKTDHRALLLTRHVEVPPVETLEHHSYYYIDLLRRLGFPDYKIKVKMKRISEPPQILLDNYFERDKKTIGINPGAAYGSAKRWLSSGFRKIIEDYLSRKFQIIVFGSKTEKQLADEIIEENTGVINLTGKTTLSELIESIAVCDLFLTNDSGPMHITAGLDIPQVAIFGPTNYKLTRPFTGRYRIVTTNEPCSPCMKRTCPLKHHNCMKNITPEMVLSELHRMEKLI